MIRVEFKGYVNGVRTFDWGVVYNVAHNQVTKNHQGEWETVGRDYFSVVAPKDAPAFAENDQVEIVGKLKTKTYEKKDGTGKGVSLEVRAETMVKVERNGNVNPVMQQTLNISTPDVQGVWPAVRQIDDSAPF
jgi:single-stranded DNA-binding protein